MDQEFYHALQVNNKLCYGCSHCISVCPTEAIRIKNGLATIIPDKCVDCGECMKACSVNAIFIVHDDFSTIFNYKYRVALVPTVFYGQFPNNTEIETINNQLLNLGFTHVVNAGIGVELLANETKNYLQTHNENKPLISPFCPAILRLIQVRFPSLVDNIIHLKTPLDIASFYLREKLAETGAFDEEIGIFFITPCAAKIAAIKTPIGEKKSTISGVINMDFIYNRIIKNLRTKDIKIADGEIIENHTRQSIYWALTGGETMNQQGNCLAIDEIHNVIEILEKIENDQIKNIDFLELRACDQSCAGGILTAKNRFLTVDYLKKKAETLPRAETPAEFRKYETNCINQLKVEKIRPRTSMTLDEDTGKAMQKMQKVRKYMCFLPGFDCGACGAPSCKSLAEDIVQRKANISDCIFMQRTMEKHKKLLPEHAYEIIEKIWGKNRLNKNCNKAGEINDNF